ncbi:flagellar biosynthesis protein FlhF [Clostridium algifaecis]|uniref:Flagellar biosynthesis protein FlhF n=1 Tax=Clostridium algifaecis TaxID=1472040 RepID=A0ABS4KMY4_9CLOT|nr:flagellar biosynthesis protein FlhF [Clostridium algifaecis]MBP2031394.1 flagellar biosynthesis protein FlhF [Clostridium algifaecis]
MIIKRYRVKSMNEAITRIKYELGREAVIISQRKVRKKGFLGFFSKKILEVTAAVNDPEEKNKYENSSTDSVENFKKVVNDKIRNQKRQSDFNYAQSVNLRSENNEALLKEVHQMKNMLDDMSKKSYDSLGKSKLELKLENMDINKKVIENIMNKVKEIQQDVEEKKKLKMVIGNMIKVEDKVLENAVVLVGPTGVGKTTTIAKIAGKMSLIEKKKVGLITIDTYRIGAVEQLRTYADIMNIPFKVVLNIKDMEKAIDSMKNCDIILIDTTGRSSKNKMQLSELRAFIDRINTKNIHLVISCTTKNRDIDTIVNGYKELNYNNVIITKLDETSTYGSILNIIDAAGKPVSFVTTGQNVPEDIEVMNSQKLTELVLGEDIIC